MLERFGRPVLGVVDQGPLSGVGGQAGDLGDDGPDRIAEGTGLVEPERHRPTGRAGGPERNGDDRSFPRQRLNLIDPRIGVADILGRGELQRDPAPDGVRPGSIARRSRPRPASGNAPPRPPKSETATDPVRSSSTARAQRASTAAAP